jgi:hypothetical protein
MRAWLVSGPRSGSDRAAGRAGTCACARGIQVRRGREGRREGRRRSVRERRRRRSTLAPSPLLPPWAFLVRGSYRRAGQWGRALQTRALGRGEAARGEGGVGGGAQEGEIRRGVREKGSPVPSLFLLFPLDSHALEKQRAVAVRSGLGGNGVGGSRTSPCRIRKWCVVPKDKKDAVLCCVRAKGAVAARRLLEGGRATWRPRFGRSAAATACSSGPSPTRFFVPGRESQRTHLVATK